MTPSGCSYREIADASRRSALSPCGFCRSRRGVASPMWFREPNRSHTTARQLSFVFAAVCQQGSPSEGRLFQRWRGLRTADLSRNDRTEISPLPVRLITRRHESRHLSSPPSSRARVLYHEFASVLVVARLCFGADHGGHDRGQGAILTAPSRRSATAGTAPWRLRYGG